MFGVSSSSSPSFRGGNDGEDGGGAGTKEEEEEEEKTFLSPTRSSKNREKNDDFCDRTRQLWVEGEPPKVSAKLKRGGNGGAPKNLPRFAPPKCKRDRMERVRMAIAVATRYARGRTTTSWADVLVKKVHANLPKQWKAEIIFYEDGGDDDDDDDDDDDKKEENGKTTAVRYLHEGLTVSDKLLREAKREERKATLKQGKIFLVLDLDHTVLNSCRFDEVNDEERATLDAKVAKREEEDELRKTLLGMVGSGNGRGGRRPRFPDLYRLSHFSTYTKLRPYVFEFLEAAAKICRMHVYTMGDKNYAHEMASLIDPEGKYFHGRIIGNSDSTCSKTKDLDIVLGGDDCTMIVDDTSRVWPRHARNLIRVDRYHFFRKSATSFREMEKSSVMERGLDEGEAEEEGAPAKHREVLKDVLAVLTVAHRMMAFSDSGDDGGDAREIRDHKDVRKVFERNNYEAREGQNGEKVDDEGGRDPSSSLLFLKGCVILPSGITPSNDERPDRHPLLLIAVGLGATIATAMNDNVTHVLARSDNTEKVKWGRKRGLFIVNGNWLRECAMQNAKLDEHNFATLQ